MIVVDTNILVYRLLPSPRAAEFESLLAALPKVCRSLANAASAP